MIDRSCISSGSDIDLLANSQRSLTHFIVRAFVSKDRGIECVPGNHDGIITDLGMPLRVSEHEGWQNDKGVCSPNQKAQMLQFLQGVLLFSLLVEQA